MTIINKDIHSIPYQELAFYLDSLLLLNYKTDHAFGELVITDLEKRQIDFLNSSNI